MHSGPSVTTDEYLAIERAAEFRNELVGGEMLPMRGGTMNHALVVSSALFQLMSQLSGGKCRAVANDLRVFSQAHQVFTYPDIVRRPAVATNGFRHPDQFTSSPSMNCFG